MSQTAIGEGKCRSISLVDEYAANTILTGTDKIDEKYARHRPGWLLSKPGIVRISTGGMNLMPARPYVASIMLLRLMPIVLWWKYMTSDSNGIAYKNAITIS